MPRKLEKIELKKIQDFEKRWLKSGRQKPVAYGQSLMGRYLQKRRPNAKDALKQSLEKELQRILLSPIEDKSALKKKILSHLTAKEMDELRNSDYKLLEKSALHDRWKLGLNAATKNVAHSQGKWNLEELPLELEAIYHTIEQVGTSYGADFLTYAERVYALMLMDLILTQDTVERQKRLADLERFQQFIKSQKSPLWIHHAQYHYEKVSRELAEHLTQAMMTCYGHQCVPVVGLLTGAVDNYLVVQNVAHVALQFYKKRMIGLKSK